MNAEIFPMNRSESCKRDGYLGFGTALSVVTHAINENTFAVALFVQCSEWLANSCGSTLQVNQIAQSSWT